MTARSGSLSRRGSSALGGLALAIALALSGCGGPDAAELLANGLALEAKGDRKSAEIQYRAALQANPQFHAARLAFGKLLLAEGDSEAATVELERVLSQAPATPGIYEIYARALVGSTNERRAIQALTALKPASAADVALVRAHLASVWSSLGDQKKADEALASALAADARHPLALTYSARRAWILGRKEEAQRQVAQALEAAPQHPEALHFQGVLQQAEGNVAAAISNWQKALESTPAHVPSHESLIAARIAANDVAQARVQFERLRARVAWHPSVRLAEARIFIAEGDLPKARERVLGLLSTAPDHPSLLALAGAIEARIGSPVQSAAHYRKLLSSNPGRDAVRLELAQVELRLGQYSDAAKTLRPLVAAERVTAQVLSLASEIELRQGNFKLADELLKRATEAAPDDARLQAARLVRRMRLGEVDQPLVQLEQLATESKESFADEALFAAQMALGDYEAAIKALERLEAKEPDKARHAEMRARVHLERRDFVKARPALEAALKLDPKGFGPVAALAMIDQLEDRPDQAIARVKAVIDKDPDHSAALVLLSDFVSRRDGAGDQPAALLRRAIAASPTSVEPRLKLIELSLGRRLHKEALDHARAALAVLPNDERLLDAAGRAQLLSGDVEQAATTFRSLATLLPKSAAPLLQLARVYDVQGRRDAVIASLQRAVELEPTSEPVQRAYVDLLIASRQGAQALAHVRRLRETKPKEPIAYMLLASVQERNRDIPAATATLRDGLAQTSRPELAHRLFGLLMRQGKADEAKVFAAQWMRRAPEDLAFEALVAEQEILSGSLKAAEERLRRVVKHYPANAQALNNLAWVVANLGGSDAVAFARRALSIAPDRPDLLDTLAVALSASGRHQDAVAVQRRAVELSPSTPILRLGLIRLALAAGDKAMARTELAALKVLDPKFGAEKAVTDLEAKL